MSFSISTCAPVSHNTLPNSVSERIAFHPVSGTIGAEVSGIDLEKKRIRFAHRFADLSFDRLVMAPGVDFMDEAIEGLDANARGTILHAWKAGPQTLALRRPKKFRVLFDGRLAPAVCAKDMALHLARAYGVPQQSGEIADPSIATLLAEESGAVIGYAQVRHDHAPACVSGPAPIELWRFYVRHEWHGRGVAHPLMERVKDEARRRGALASAA